MVAMVEDAWSPHLKYTRLHFMWRMALVYLSFLFVRHTSSSNIPGLAQIARIDRPCIYRMTKSIQKSVGGYDFGGIKWQYGFSMAGADAGVRFRSAPHIRRCCRLHPQITGHPLLCFLEVRCPPLPFLFLLNYFHPFLQHQMMSWLVSEESWDFGMWNMSFTKMETVYGQNVRSEFVVTWKPELLNGYGV